MQTRCRGEWRRPEAAVIVDARRNQRVSQLQKNRARPPEQDEPFGVDALRDYRRSFSAPDAPLVVSDAAFAEADFSAIALAAADFHNQPATPTSARLIAP